MLCAIGLQAHLYEGSDGILSIDGNVARITGRNPQAATFDLVAGYADSYAAAIEHFASAVQTGAPNSRSMPGGVNIAVAGGLPFGVAYTLDGATHNNPQSNVNLPLPFPDALQEFRVERALRTR